MRNRFERWIVLAIAPTALGLAACAAAPTTFKSQADSETVQLGVSRIPRTVEVDNPNRTTISPVTIITREELERTGAVDLGDALKRSRAGVFLGR